MENDLKPGYGDSFWYATKVWGTGVIVLPILMSIFFLFRQSQNAVMGPISIVLLTLMISGIFSIPSWLLLSFATHAVRQQTWNNSNKKVVLAVVAILLTILPFLMLAGFEFDRDAVLISLVYAIPVCLGIFGYSFEENEASIQGHTEEANEISDILIHESPTLQQHD